MIITGLQHCLNSDAARVAHESYLYSEFGVKVEFLGEDEMQFEGTPEDVRQAVIDHYYRDAQEAEELHPEIKLVDSPEQ